MNFSDPDAKHIGRCIRLVAAAGLVAAALASCGDAEPDRRSVSETISDHTSAAPPLHTETRTDTPAPSQATTGSLVGSWEASDGSELKVLNADGSCQGFFYDSSTGKPLDIGGPSSCQVSSSQDESGRYRLKVNQGPNRATYLVEFHGDDAATVYTKSGTELYSLTRF